MAGLNKDTTTTIIGIATLIATLAQIVAQFFGGMDAHTTATTMPLTTGLGMAALGLKSKGA